MQVANEKERGIAYRYYVEQVASMPSFVGAHWFAWLDESIVGAWTVRTTALGLSMSPTARRMISFKG